MADRWSELRRWISREIVWSLCAGAMLAVAWVLEGQSWAPRALVALLYAGSFVLGSLDLALHSLKEWRHGHFHFNIDLLMLVAALGAAVLGQYSEGAFLLFLFSLAHGLEHAALDHAKGAIRSLADLAPAKARVIRDGRDTEVLVDQVIRGERILVRPGERVPVDGLVVEGRSSVDQAPITGESVPVMKERGAEVFAGTINGDGALTVETTAVVGDRTIDRVIRLVTEARKNKAPTQRFVDRFEQVFVPVVLIVDVLVLTVPALLGFWSWQTGFYRAMGLLVAASPCALALGTPSAVLAAIAQAARKGVLIKGGVPLETLGVVTAMAFDKTGTLTQGRPTVTSVEPADGVAPFELLQVTASIERSSQHPLAIGIVARAASDGIPLLESIDAQSEPGLGIRSKIDGELVEVGQPRLWNEQELPAALLERSKLLELAGQSVLLTKKGERWLGVIGLEDSVRPEARHVIEQLKRLGIGSLIMVTGDHPTIAQRIGSAAGINQFRTQLLPEGKVEAIREIQSRGERVAMIGDGVNDAPALALADVGIAMGGAGTAAALESADVALMSDDMNRLPFAVGLSRAAKRVITQNLFVALGVIGVLVFTSLTGLSGIGLTVVAHEGSTLLVLANALRLLTYDLKASWNAGDSSPMSRPGEAVDAVG